MYILYSALLAVAMLLATPFWLWQMLRHGKYRTGFSERWGKVPARITGEPVKPVIWIHAVSVGEVLAITGLAEEMRVRFPAYRLVISTTTDTGQKLARKRFGDNNVFYFPLDFAFTIRPYLRALQPKLILLAETEFWPNFLRLGKASGAKIAVVNARISDRSLPGYKRFRGLLRGILSSIDLFLAQTEQDQLRLREIGAVADYVRVSGNLKFDTPQRQEPPIVSVMQIAMMAENVGPVIVCGSTLEGEEAMLVRAYKSLLTDHPKALMMLAPRHPERFDAVVQMLEQQDVPFVRRSQWRGADIAGRVFLLDSIGELASLYSFANISFVGGSLVPAGGHNILEPARYGSAIVVGEHTENFRDIVELFRSQNALLVTNPIHLQKDLTELMADQSRRLALGQRAIEVLRSQTGATERTLSAIASLIDIGGR